MSPDSRAFLSPPSAMTMRPDEAQDLPSGHLNLFSLSSVFSATQRASQGSDGERIEDDTLSMQNALASMASSSSRAPLQMVPMPSMGSHSDQASPIEMLLNDTESEGLGQQYGLGQGSAPMSYSPTPMDLSMMSSMSGHVSPHSEPLHHPLILVDPSAVLATASSASSPGPGSAAQRRGRGRLPAATNIMIPTIDGGQISLDDAVNAFVDSLLPLSEGQRRAEEIAHMLNLSDTEKWKSNEYKCTKNLDAAKRSRLRKKIRVDILQSTMSSLGQSNAELKERVAELEAENAALRERLKRYEQ